MGYIYISNIGIKWKKKLCYVTYNSDASPHTCIIGGNLILMKNYIYSGDTLI